MHRFRVTILVGVFFLIVGVLTTIFADNQMVEDASYIVPAADSVSLQSGMEAAGYSFVASESITYEKKSPPITIRFNIAAQTAEKNEFVFSIAGKFHFVADELYIDRKILSEIIGRSIVVREGNIEVADFAYVQHEWTMLSDGFIAHAAGGIDGFEGTNAQDALVVNYNLGHRVFEIDLNLTTDHNLAAVHDWAGYSGAKSTADWAAIKIRDRYQSMTIDEILDFMMVNGDMFLVTDTKSFEYETDDVVRQFQILYDKAMVRDLRLLDRVVPQIYNQGMYELVCGVYPFPSIIYTLYESPDSDEEVVSFVKARDDIKVVTMAPVRYKDAFFQELTAAGKYVYFFTLNDAAEVEEYWKKGIHGIYTDFLVPRSGGVAVSQEQTIISGVSE